MEAVFGVENSVRDLIEMGKKLRTGDMRNQKCGRQP